MSTDNVPTTPGFGVSGMVMCPLFKSVCMKSGCEMWVELKCGTSMVGRCTFAWLSVVATETRMAIDKLKEITNGE